MDLELNGQRVVVFGSAKGIGAAIARRFKEEGAEVFGFDRAPSDSPPPEIQTFAGNVTEPEAVDRFASQFDRIDHMIYSVGVGSGKVGFPFWNLDPADWSRVVEVNLIGAVTAAHLFAPKLIANGSGTMLFLVSVAGQIGSQTDPPYSAAKAGLINFMQCSAKDLAPHNIRANALSPGMVKTELNRSVWAASQEKLPAKERVSYQDWGQEKTRKVAPLGRWQEPAEFASMAAYLASKHATNITGQTINIDGGQVMHA